MELIKKLEILADSAKYDASCSSSGSDRKNAGGIGNGKMCGVCHSFASDGRCISLLKILMTNMCVFDCKYCINRRSNNVERAIFTPEELCEITINFYKRNYIEGLFLSSGIIKNADYTMERLIETISLLRNKYHFNGYVHAKTIPGASKYLINKLGHLVDRMSINIELPSKPSLLLLAPDKKSDVIGTAMNYIKENKNKNFVPAGQSTQLIIGATPDSDYQIMSLSSHMYDKYDLKRVFYSAYIPINKDNLLPAIKNPPLVRENRLYQADWLLRFYGFKINDLLDSSNPNFNVLIDPKADWALKHLDKFPIEINKASYEDLLKVPGIGVLGAKKIIKTRRFAKIDFADLKKLGIVLKRARYFITCNDKYFASTEFFKKSLIESSLIHEERKLLVNNNFQQLNLFE